MKLLRRLTVALVLIGAGAVYAAFGFYTVEPDEEAVILRLGRYAGTAGPGKYRWRAPWIDRLEIHPVTLTYREEFGYRTEEPGREYRTDPEDERRMITGDTNVVNVEFVLQYQISNLADYVLNLQDPRAVIRDAAQSAIRAVVARHPIDSVLTELKQQIEGDTKRLIQRSLDRYGAGIEVQTVLLQDVEPPDPVKEAFVEVTSAEQDRERMILEAQGYADKVIPEARGRAEELLNQARAYQQTRVLHAQGEAGRFTAVLEEYLKAKEVTRSRLYIETLEAILPRMDKVILEEGGSERVLPYLPVGPRGRQQ